MKVQFLSKGFDVTIKTNEVIENNEMYTCHILFKLINIGIYLYGYDGEYPYHNFNAFNLTQVVIREPKNECLRYVLYSLSTSDYLLMKKMLNSVKNNLIEDTNFEWVQEDVVFEDNGKLGVDMMPALVKTADSNFDRSRLKDPLIKNINRKGVNGWNIH